MVIIITWAGEIGAQLEFVTQRHIPQERLLEL